MRTGANEFGQLGDGTEESAQEPKKVKSLETELLLLSLEKMMAHYPKAGFGCGDKIRFVQ